MNYIDKKLIGWPSQSARYLRLRYSLARKIYKQKADNAFNDGRKYFSALRNKYKGQRGFVVGNGPSLKLSDLELIKDEITIASNKIYLAFDQISWRPTYYTACDNLVILKTHQTVGSFVDRIIMPDHLYLPHPGCKIYTFKSLGRIDRDPVSDIKFSSNINDGLWGGSSVTYVNIQLAAHLGLNPIYLIGCDHYYSENPEATAMNPIQEKSATNHFVKGYRYKGEIVNPAPIDLLNFGYAHASAYANREGREILNATRGGHLEIFPRAKFESLF